ncbi:aryl-alcohol-oxidase from pleurotus Eryingii [Hymenopellis radicata]|nr:aryl-alcohol-oxidase from pleurotus Eryingii [Hymenopellis radicata]
MMLPLISICFLLVQTAFGLIYETIEDLPNQTYDFVVVGGGTAGNVIANRLTEDPAVTVLVLEAAGSNEGVLLSEVPFFCAQLMGSAYDWNFTTTVQPGLNGRAISYPRGYMLGGSSSINFMVYTRGSADDFNRYARLTGDDGWSWNEMLPYILKNERIVAPSDGHDTTGEFDPAAHSYTGVNFVSLPGYPRGTDDKILQAVDELPEQFPYDLDYNDGKPNGIGWLQSTVGNGARSSSATSYLGPEYIGRPNLHVLLHSYVTRILPKDSEGSELHFDTVEFMHGSDGAIHTLTPNREIVLSAGAIGTPHILLNSGIGDSDTLSTIGIDTTLHLPSVGQNLTEHPRFTLDWSISDNNTFESVYWRNATFQQEALTEWQESRTGFLSSNPYSQVGFLRFPEEEVTWNDICAGPETPQYEIIFGNGLLSPSVPATGDTFNIGVIALCPLSRGNITINSTDFLTPPLLNPNLLFDPQDVAILKAGTEHVQQFVAASSWNDYILSPLTNVTDDAIRDGGAITFHPVGTASMSPVGADWGVVDPDLLLKGAKGVRIVDASVLPFVPSAHTQAPVYAFAERAADLIKQAWTL